MYIERERERERARERGGNRQLTINANYDQKAQLKTIYPLTYIKTVLFPLCNQQNILLNPHSLTKKK